MASLNKENLSPAAFIGVRGNDIIPTLVWGTGSISTGRSI